MSNKPIATAPAVVLFAAAVIIADTRGNRDDV